MAKPKPDSVEAQIAALTVPERVLLFCVGSKTEWAQVGVTGATATAMMVKGLIERDAVGKLALTEVGRATLSALLACEPIEPMTLGNMRAKGVRSLLASCHKCHHVMIIEADQWLDRIEVSSFGPHIACAKCGSIGADVRPNWREREDSRVWRR